MSELHPHYIPLTTYLPYPFTYSCDFVWKTKICHRLCPHANTCTVHHTGAGVCGAGSGYLAASALVQRGAPRHYIHTYTIFWSIIFPCIYKYMYYTTQVLEYAAQVADILRYLHLCNVVHRDIKPENLLVDSRGLLKVVCSVLQCVASCCSVLHWIARRFARAAQDRLQCVAARCNHLLVYPRGLLKCDCSLLQSVAVINSLIRAGYFKTAVLSVHSTGRSIRQQYISVCYVVLQWLIRAGCSR